MKTLPLIWKGLSNLFVIGSVNYSFACQYNSVITHKIYFVLKLKLKTEP